MALPTARTPGFTSFQTRWGPRTACECLAQWLPAFARRLGVSISALQITQLTGGASASAGTHSQGGAADLLVTNREWVRIAREMGAAAWVRTRAQGFDVDHIHLVLNGCPHNGPARYQVNALAAGFNGLGSGGRGGRDDGPGPQKLRTWSQGIAWALGVNASTSTTAQQEEDMAYFIQAETSPGKGHQFVLSHGKVTHKNNSSAVTQNVLGKVHRVSVDDALALGADLGIDPKAWDPRRGVVLDPRTGKAGPGQTWTREEAMR